MQLRLRTWPYRFAEQVLNSKLVLKKEIEEVLSDPSIEIPSLSRPVFNEVPKERFVDKGWQSQPPVFDEPGLPAAGVTFPHGIETYGVASGRGRLARFRDPTGNRLELVEPASADLNDTSGDRL